MFLFGRLEVRRLEEVAVVAAQTRRYGWLNTPNDILIRGFHSLSSSPGHEAFHWGFMRDSIQQTVCSKCRQ